MYKKIILLLSIAWLLANNTQAQEWTIVYQYTAKQNPLIFKHQQSFMQQLYKKVMDQKLKGYRQFEWGKYKSPKQPYTSLELKKQYILPIFEEDDDWGNDSWGGSSSTEVESNSDSETKEKASYYFASQLGLAIGFKVHETKGLTSLNTLESFIPTEYSPTGIQRSAAFYSFKKVSKALRKSFLHQWTPPENHQQTLSWQEALQQRALIPQKIRIFYGQKEIVEFNKRYQGNEIDSIWSAEKSTPIPDYVTQWVKWESQVAIQQQGSKRISIAETSYDLSEQHNTLLDSSLTKIIEGIVLGKLIAYAEFNTETSQFDKPLDTASLIKRIPFPVSLDVNDPAAQADYHNFNWGVTREVTSGENVQKKPLAYTIILPARNTISGLTVNIAHFKPNELIAFLKNEGHEKAATYIVQDNYTGWTSIFMHDLFNNEYFSYPDISLETTEEEMKTMPQWFIDDVRKVLQELK
ncbi:hypothetical protein WAF17_15765 [Bernardetia sp. ABR2-2B]|uniref:hypothetical protein n=1 Tax=Bernardetia sp. ABR2-2B TaxID=3127472 RepID=UPI0030CE6B73